MAACVTLGAALASCSQEDVVATLGHGGSTSSTSRTATSSSSSSSGAPTGGSGGAGSVDAGSPCDPAVIVSRPIVPPWHMMGLDLVGADGGLLTLDEAVAHNCAGVDAGGRWPGGAGIAWGDAGQAAFRYDILSGRFEQAILSEGYSGKLTWHSADLVHTYVAAIGSPILKDGAPFPVDWADTAQVDIELTELYNGMVATFATGIPQSLNCAVDGGCLVYDDGIDPATFGVRPLHFNFVFGDAGDGGPGQSTLTGVYNFAPVSWNDFTQTSLWSAFDTTQVDPHAEGFRGAEYDGRYLYLVPNAAGALVTRYDTEASLSFTDPSSWATFDTTTVDPGAAGFSGGCFDNQYVYFAPGSSGLVTFYDSTQTFQLPSAWSTFDTTTLTPPASRFAGAVFNELTMESVFIPAADGVVATVGELDPTSWSSFDLTTIDPRLQQFRGGAVLSQYVYPAPHGPGPYPGLAIQYGSNETFDLSTLDPAMAGLFAYAGAVTDTYRYVYYVPASNGTGSGDVVRYDATLPFTTASAWSFYPLSPADFTTGAWDGRYVYLSGSSSTVVRYDSTVSFTDPAAWTTFDTSAVAPGPLAFFGSLDDRRYLYLVPDTFSTLLRYDASFPPTTVEVWQASAY